MKRKLTKLEKFCCVAFPAWFVGAYFITPIIMTPLGILLFAIVLILGERKK